MKAYDVFRTENGGSGKTDYLDTLMAYDQHDALATAKSTFPCPETAHLWVRRTMATERDRRRKETELP